MNLTFIYDGYLAETALESSFQLFVFDGYLIYGEVPPPPPSPSITEGGASGKYNLYREIEEEKKRKRKQEEGLILTVLKGWSEYLN